MSDDSEAQPRRAFLKHSLAGTGVTLSGLFPAAASNRLQAAIFQETEAPEPQLTMIGAYGDWAANIVGDGPARLSFRQPRFADVAAWRNEAKQRVLDCLASPPQPSLPLTDVRVDVTLEFDGLQVERLSWQLSYGPRTAAVVLKPLGATGKLPAVVGLHDHGGNKYFGHEKITRTGPARQSHLNPREIEDELFQDGGGEGCAVAFTAEIVFDRCVRREDGYGQAS